MDETEKVCFKCGMLLSLSCFYKHPMMSDGHLNKCKDCAKKDVKENREENSDYYRAYDRERSKQLHRKQLAKKVSQYSKSKETKRKLDRLALGTKQKIATSQVNNALRYGKLNKLPCFICGSLDVQGHHPSYDLPLDVVWLCVEHHMIIHRKYDEEYNKEILGENINEQS